MNTSDEEDNTDAFFDPNKKAVKQSGFANNVNHLFLYFSRVLHLASAMMVCSLLMINMLFDRMLTLNVPVL